MEHVQDESNAPHVPIGIKNFVLLAFQKIKTLQLLTFCDGSAAKVWFGTNVLTALVIDVYIVADERKAGAMLRRAFADKVPQPPSGQLGSGQVDNGQAGNGQLGSGQVDNGQAGNGVHNVGPHGWPSDASYMGSPVPAASAAAAAAVATSSTAAAAVGGSATGPDDGTTGGCSRCAAEGRLCFGPQV